MNSESDDASNWLTVGPTIRPTAADVSAGPRSTPNAPVVSNRASSASLLPVVAAMAISLAGGWLSARTGDNTSRYNGLEVPILRYALAVSVIMALLGVLIEGLVLGRWPLSVPAVAGTVLLVLASLMLLLEEVAASFIPNSFLPTSVRRMTVDIYGGVGIWVGALASFVLVVVSQIDGGTIGLVRRARLGAQRLPSRWLAASAGVALSVGVAAWSRYQPWASGSAGTKHVDVPGWSLPFMGPASLIGVVALGIAASVLAVRRNLLAALALAAIGWVLSFFAAIVLVGASTLTKVQVKQFLPTSVEQYQPSIQARWGAWVMFGTGCAVAACATVIVSASERRRS